jgi:hypothetical protein
MPDENGMLAFLLAALVLADPRSGNAVSARCDVLGLGG